MPFPNGTGAPKGRRDHRLCGYFALTLKLLEPVQNRDIHGRQGETFRLTPTLRAAATIDAHVSPGSGTPLKARFARAARSGSPGVRIDSPGMAFACWNQLR